MQKKDFRILCWFSCGCPSTIATKLALKQYGDRCLIYYCDTNSEHPDNQRYLSDCQDWFDQEIIILKSEQYKDIYDVFNKTRWLVGAKGARCTVELKKKLRHKVQKVDDLQVFGYTIEEKKRVERLMTNNPEINLLTPLIEKELTREDCIAMVDKVGIKTPAMYELGYRNNNCIGCVKGQAGYWNKIRVDFPEVFNRMAKVERNLGVAINRSYKKANHLQPVFLDELGKDVGNYETEPDISCGIMCEIASSDLE